MSKLRFRVIFHDSEDAGYPADELNSHTPQTRGWKSAKYCEYPQELGFELLGGNATLTQIQILSHQALISTRIEIFIGSKASSYRLSKFTKLGFLTLNSNERAGFQARELKTVHVNNAGQYIKFLCHRNYENQYNPHSQIGIVAVNFLGFDDESSGSLAYADDINNSTMDNQRSALNDLSVDMNLDSQTASKLRLLAEAKSRAIANEDYLTAKDIKAVESDLKILGSQLAQLDLAKREAVRAEDFDRAKEIKDDCDKIRREIEHRVMSAQIPGVTDTRLPHSYGNPRNISPARQNYPDEEYDTAAEAKESSRVVQKSTRAAPTSLASYQDSSLSEDRPIRAAPTGTYQEDDIRGGMDEGPGLGEYEEEAGPASMQFPAGQHPLEGVANLASLPAPKDIKGLQREHAESTGITALIGEYRVKCLFQPTAWNLREACINKVQLMLDELTSQMGIQACIAPLLAIVKIGIEDKMQQVFFSAMSLLEAILIAAKRQKVTKSVVAPLAEPIINALIEKMNDVNARIRDGSKRAMEMLSASPCVGPQVVASHTLRPLNAKQKNGWRPLYNRLTLVSDVVSAHGVGTSSGISMDAVLNFLKSNNAFIHSNGEVRDACRDVCVSVARSVGSIDPINPYLSELRQTQKEEYKGAFIKAGLSVGPAGVGVNTGAAGPAAPTAANNESPRGAAPSGKQPTNASNTASPTPGRKSNAAANADAKGQAQPKNSGPPPAASSSSSPRPSQQQGHNHQMHEAHGHVNSNNNNNNNNDLNNAAEDFICNFCGAGDETWDEDALDMHYLRDCPLLAPCPACGQVLEIAALPDHILDECDHKSEYVACDVTGLAIRASEFASWKTSPNYCSPPDNCFYCPLCLVAVEDSNDAWKEHLVTQCRKNTRTQGR